MQIDGSRRRYAAIAVVVVLGLVGAACGDDDDDEPQTTPTATGGLDQPEVTEIKHALPFPVIPFAAPHYVAVEKGFFEEVGLDVEILPGESGATSLGAVQAGKAQFGHADLTALSLAKSEDPSVEVIQIYNVFRKPAAVIYSLASGANITTQEQITETELYTEPGSISRDIIQGWATERGLPELTFKDVDPEARDRLLIAGRIPATAGFLGSRGVLLGAAEEAGVELVTFELANYGLNIYTSGISVNRSFAEENPNTVKAYLSALNKAYIYTFENKEEAGEIMNGLFPEISPESVVGSMESLEYSMTSDGFITFEELGTYDPKRVEGTVDFINEVFDLDVSSQDLLTSEFVDQIDRQ